MVIVIPASFSAKPPDGEYWRTDDLNLKDLVDNIMDHVMDIPLGNVTYLSHDYNTISFDVVFMAGLTTLTLNREFVEQQIIMEFL